MLYRMPKKLFAFFKTIFLIGTITIEGSFRTSHKYDDHMLKLHGKVLKKFDFENLEEDSPVSVTADLDTSSSLRINSVNFSDKKVKEDCNLDLIFNMDDESVSSATVSNLNEELINDHQIINNGIRSGKN